ncbi:MAG TPA: photoactive yellow protein [Gemmatimonadales bacterium]|jgi:photoactive yellow protein|nr:photoactive yellow protein [Gemmatimonadales bacterium]
MPQPQLDRVKFDQNDIDNVLATLTPDQVDQLAFGAIQVDANGTVLSFNTTESQLTHRDKKDVVGRNFFTEVAPCTNRPEFYGRFVNEVRAQGRSVLFEYIFDYKMNPTRVRVHMKKAITGDTYWFLVNRI